MGRIVEKVCFESGVGERKSDAVKVMIMIMMIMMMSWCKMT